MLSEVCDDDSLDECSEIPIKRRRGVKSTALPKNSDIESLLFSGFIGVVFIYVLCFLVTLLLCGQLVLNNYLDKPIYNVSHVSASPCVIKQYGVVVFMCFKYDLLYFCR